jgi:6,7-dimethyl-8-ribityllumazine synthase
MARYDDILELEPGLDGAGLRIGIIMSRFNIDVCEGLLAACSAELRKHGVRPEDMLLVTVPGALEIGLAAQKLAASRRFDALCALGAVIRGETYHFEIVAGESARGIMALTMDGIPVGNGILTVENEAQALVRADPEQSNKGGDAAKAAMALLTIKEQYA